MVIQYLDFANRLLDQRVQQMINGIKASPSLKRKLELLAQWEQEDLKRYNYGRSAWQDDIIQT